MNTAKSPYQGASMYSAIGGTQVWINFKGVFHIEMLYKLMFEVLQKRGYNDDSPENGEHIEQYYFENRAPDGVKTEAWYWWRTKRSGKAMNNANFEFVMNIDVQILGLKEEVIVVDGQKFKMSSGEISFFIKPYLNVKAEEKKYKDLVPTDFFNWWMKRAFYNQVEDARNELYDDFNIIYGTIKQYLKLNNYAPVPGEFHPQLGIPQYKL
jgi:hypothetical protein